jgi:septal ring factor EnvC (AmiA/AmiB activator)
MFKHLSNILSTITPGQRLIALCFLLFTIVIITVAPNLIDATTKDTEELTIKIDRQRTEIKDLSDQIQKLNDQLILNESECTNRLIDKQRQILTVIDQLERDLAPSQPVRRVSSYRMIHDSTVAMMMPPPPEQMPQQDNSKALSRLKTLKRDLSKDIKKP